MASKTHFEQGSYEILEEREKALLVRFDNGGSQYTVWLPRSAASEIEVPWAAVNDPNRTRTVLSVAAWLVRNERLYHYA